jgi:hypothetical protein
MKTRRSLDSLLDTVRSHPPTARLVERDEVRTILVRRDAPAAPRRYSRSLVMSIPTAVAAAGAAIYFGLGSATEPVPTTRISVPATPRPIAETAPAHRSPHRPVERPRVVAPERPRVSASAARDDQEYRTIVDLPPDVPSGGARFTYTTRDSAEIAQMLASDTSDGRLDIARLGYIELSRAEAARLGITVSDRRLELLADDYSAMSIRERDQNEKITLYDGERPSGAPRLRRFRIEIGTESANFQSAPLDDEATPLAIAPIIVVNQYRTDLSREGSTLLYFQNAPSLHHFEDYELFENIPKSVVFNVGTPDSSVRGNALLGRLVPVYLKLDDGPIDGTSLRRGSEVSLWYVPTPQFIAALPERYRGSLEREVSAITEVARDCGTVEQACDRIAGRPSYLEVCRVSSGAVNTATVAPNPAHERTTLSFRLAEPRRVAITLHDINGRYLRHLLYEEDRQAGEQSVEASLAGLSQGAYLVAVRTERGEQAVARLIVE